MWRPAGCAALAFVAAGMRVEQDSPAEPRTLPTEEERADDFFQCDRQCRWYSSDDHVDFFNRNIIGKKISGKECACFDARDPAAVRPNVPYMQKKFFDVKNTWSGGEEDGKQTGFSCTDICIQNEHGELETVNKEAAEGREGITRLHCGVCSACSAPEDIEVLWNTRTWITEVMTKVSADFAKPRLLGGHQNATRLADNLQGVGFNVSRVRRDGRLDAPTCMDCWTDNIMCDAKACKSKCWIKFFDPKNSKTDITGDIGLFDFNKKCLKCDEDNCGPEFIKCAGANRRSSGIESDIARPEKQKCKAGLYTGKSGLPDAPKPSKDYVDFVLGLKNGVVVGGEEQYVYQKMFNTHRCCCRDDGDRQCWWFSKEQVPGSCPRIKQTESGWCYGASWLSSDSSTSQAADGAALCAPSEDPAYQFSGPKC